MLWPLEILVMKFIMKAILAFSNDQANRWMETMVFDWDKAATLIKESGVKCASAGLDGDWECTGGYILEDGKIPEDHSTFLESTWAKPELNINGRTIECYKMKSETDGLDADTFWPESARRILFWKGE